MISLQTMENQKGVSGAYEMHCHILFPVKYQEAPLKTKNAPAIKAINLGLEER
jgi:hypothetical protein